MKKWFDQKCKSLNNRRKQLSQLKLYTFGIRSLLIEGGDKLTKSLIKEKLIDNFYLFQSQKKISKIRFYKNFSSLEILNKKYKKKFANNLRMVKDTITIYKKKNV